MGIGLVFMLSLYSSCAKGLNGKPLRLPTGGGGKSAILSMDQIGTPGALTRRRLTEP
jgi:hypothetical protein